MGLTSQLIDLVEDELVRDCTAFLPELILCAGIVVLLLLRLMNSLNKVHLGWFALLFTLAGLWVSYAQWYPMETFDPRLGQEPPIPVGLKIFSGMLAYDNFTIFLRLFLLSFAALVIWLSLLTGIPDREDSADFYVLLLGATLGMSIMASANHLLMIYIGVEMASLPSYALAGFLKGKRQSSEASLKYVVYGGGASGIMLYGISLLVGKFGTAFLPDVASQYMHSLGVTFDPVLLLGTLFILIGIAFKLAAVPFHFWCPDVFEGASAEVAGFLSVASKGAALALLGRVSLVLAGMNMEAPMDSEGFMKVARYLVPIIAFGAAITATFGNLAAYLQTNLKRLLAYSTIAHAGYMMMGLAALTREGAAAVLFYLVAYLFMNLGAFAIVAFLRNLTGSEDLSSFRGLIRRAPVLVILLAVFLLSLLGLPPLAGFAAKLQIFGVLLDAGNHYEHIGHPRLGMIMYALLVIGGINTVISAVYYLKVLKVMILESPLDEVEGRASTPLPVTSGSAAYAYVLAVAIFVVGIFWGPVYESSQRGVDRFQRQPREVPKRVADQTRAGGV